MHVEIKFLVKFVLLYNFQMSKLCLCIHISFFLLIQVFNNHSLLIFLCIWRTSSFYNPMAADTLWTIVHVPVQAHLSTYCTNTQPKQMLCHITCSLASGMSFMDVNGEWKHSRRLEPNLQTAKTTRNPPSALNPQDDL